MKKQLLTVAALAMAMATSAQISFTEQTGTSFEGVYNSSIAFADVDGDNDQDMLITGYTNSNQTIANLYINDGNGIFTEQTGTPFDGVRRSSIAFADVDGDNDQDVLITGLNNAFQLSAKLYINDSNGTFTEQTGTPFDKLYESSIAFADVDGDNDQDVLITGSNNSSQRIAKLYANDGNGAFTEQTGTPFDGVHVASIAFSDVDGDNDQDVLITGRNNTLQPIAKLYTNDGNGAFTEQTGTPFEGVSYSSIAFADVDGDNDQDVLITGYTNSNQTIAKLYTNDGNGTFTEQTGTPFEGVSSSSIAFADVDGDNDMDVLVTGYNNSIQRIAKLYTNDGNGAFTEQTGTPFEGVSFSSIAFTDVDGDNDQDVLITGENNSFQTIAKLYINETTPVLPTDNDCTGANNINNLFGSAVNSPMVSDLQDNTGYTSTGDPATGFDCFTESTPSLEATIWYTFTGDGNTYRIRTIDCTASSPLDDSQVAVYSGADCNNLSPVACNDDEDFDNQVYNIQLDLETTQGTEYFMLIDGYGGDTGEFCLEVTKQAAVSVYERNYESIEVYPNPTSGLIQIKNVKADGVKVTDVTGRLVMQYNQPQNEIDLSQVPAGVYFLQISAQNKTYTSKVVKQ